MHLILSQPKKIAKVVHLCGLCRGICCLAVGTDKATAIAECQPYLFGSQNHRLASPGGLGQTTKSLSKIQSITLEVGHELWCQRLPSP